MQNKPGFYWCSIKIFIKTNRGYVQEHNIISVIRGFSVKDNKNNYKFLISFPAINRE